MNQDQHVVVYNLPASVAFRETPAAAVLGDLIDDTEIELMQLEHAMDAQGITTVSGEPMGRFAEVVALADIADRAGGKESWMHLHREDPEFARRSRRAIVDAGVRGPAQQDSPLRGLLAEVIDELDKHTGGQSAAEAQETLRRVHVALLRAQVSEYLGTGEVVHVPSTSEGRAIAANRAFDELYAVSHAAEIATAFAQTVEELDALGVPYRVEDLRDADPTVSAHYDSTGRTNTPIVVAANGTWWPGFKPDEIAAVAEQYRAESGRQTGHVIARDGEHVSQEDALGYIQDDEYAHLLDDPRENGLEGALFTGIDAAGSGAIFRGHYRGARFVDCNGLVFRHADLTGATFTNCTIAAADDVDFTAARLTGTRFAEGHHVGVTFRDALLQDVSMEKTRLVSVNFSEATLRNVDMKGAKVRGDYSLEGARVSDCDLRYAVFSPALNNTALADVRWERTNVDGAWFRDAMFVENGFRDMDLGRADIASASFDGSRFTAVDLADDAAVLNSAGVVFNDSPGGRPHPATRAQAMTVEVYDSLDPREPPAYEFTVPGHDVEQAIAAARARLGAEATVGTLAADEIGGAIAPVEDRDGVHGRVVVTRAEESPREVAHPIVERDAGASLSRCFAGGLSTPPTRATSAVPAAANSASGSVREAESDRGR
ncbi:pentapeptide repeat-containing protein [Tsukamurella sp. DT100]|uniref:pentapeptide repeat-containing protein n=1 Tax=Tsukamurella sp. DT100 TaxID=3393415 RepID=UPI003CF8D1A2